MYEVEVKARLRNQAEIKKKLEDLGCTFGEELHQIDHIFIPKGATFPTPLTVPVLRVREQNGKYLFTLKISQSSRQDSLERELEISDKNMMTEILNLIGYEEFILVDKKRIKTNYKDMEIVLDNVKDLGEFIEAEKIVAYDDPETRKSIHRELLAFLETLDIPPEDHIVGGKYDILLHEVNNKLSVK